MFTLNMITPHGKPRKVETAICNLVTPQGQMGILANHMPLVTMIEISMMTTIENGVRTSYAIAGGLFFFKDNEATILSDAIEKESEIDVERALSAKERAEALLSSNHPDIDIKRAEVALRKAVNRINISK
jgi:F-type H+-transporting ATPase subunit epsilon